VVTRRCSFRDLKAQRLERAEVEDLARKVGGAEKLFSKRAMKYRPMGLHEQELSEDDLLRLMAEEYTSITRPVIVRGGRATAGFSAKRVDALIDKRRAGGDGSTSSSCSGHLSPSRESDRWPARTRVNPARSRRDRMASANGPHTVRCRAGADRQGTVAKCRGHGSRWSLSVTSAFQDACGGTYIICPVNRFSRFVVHADFYCLPHAEGAEGAENRGGDFFSPRPPFLRVLRVRWGFEA
jgi:arsenate reductase